VGAAPEGKEIKRWLLPGEEDKTMAVLKGAGRRQNDGCSQGKRGKKRWLPPGVGDKTMAVPREREETKRWGLPGV